MEGLGEQAKSWRKNESLELVNFVQFPLHAVKHIVGKWLKVCTCHDSSDPTHEKTDPSVHTGLVRYAKRVSKGRDPLEGKPSTVFTKQWTTAVPLACTSSSSSCT